MTEPRVYRASGLGYSLCQMVCPHLGYEPIPAPQWLQEKFDEGKAIEPRAIQKLRDAGWYITETQSEINAVGDNQIEVDLEVIPGQVIVRGHLDGKVREGGYADVSFYNVVLEVKSMNAKTWKEFKDIGWDTPGIVQKYKWQCSVYGLATQSPVVLAAWNKETEEFAFAMMTEPFYGISDIALKLSQAEEHIRTNTIPDNCTDFPCPYFYLHENKDAIPEEKADADMDTLMDAWVKAQERAKIYDGEAKALREMLVEMAGEKIAGRVRGSQGVTVTTTWQDEAEWTTKRKAGWVTKVSAPRKRKVEDV